MPCEVQIDEVNAAVRKYEKCLDAHSRAQDALADAWDKAAEDFKNAAIAAGLVALFAIPGNLVEWTAFYRAISLAVAALPIQAQLQAGPLYKAAAAGRAAAAAVDKALEEYFKANEALRDCLNRH